MMIMGKMTDDDDDSKPNNENDKNWTVLSQSCSSANDETFQKVFSSNPDRQTDNKPTITTTSHHTTPHHTTTALDTFPTSGVSERQSREIERQRCLFWKTQRLAVVAGCTSSKQQHRHRGVREHRQTDRQTDTDRTDDPSSERRTREPVQPNDNACRCTLWIRTAPPV